LAGNKGWYDKQVYETIASANASILGIENKRSGNERRCGLDLRDDEQKKKDGERRKGKERRGSEPIKYIGYISNQEKFSLMSNAYCFIFPSIYEGFGLPVLEAMSVGTPVITSNSSSLNEIIDLSCGLLIDPLNEADIANAMGNVLTDEGFKEAYKKNCLERSLQFSWEKCAQETLEIYKNVMEKKK
jgi:glycosyltransferase involved in cell wall biosynthesis